MQRTVFIIELIFERFRGFCPRNDDFVKIRSVHNAKMFSFIPSVFCLYKRFFVLIK